MRLSFSHNRDVGKGAVLARVAQLQDGNPVMLKTLMMAPLKHPSPNCDERPVGIVIDTVVLHATVLDSLEEVIERFADAQAKVSSHYTIDRNGAIASHVPEHQRAWHAGQSQMKDGRVSVNDFSIGIELVNLNDGSDPYPESQINALRDLLAAIMARHPIQHIVTHSECAVPPGRKSDPLGFDMTRVQDLLALH